jgi:hypothetical protein
MLLPPVVVSEAVAVSVELMFTARGSGVTTTFEVIGPTVSMVTLPILFPRFSFVEAYVLTRFPKLNVRFVHSE